MPSSGLPPTAAGGALASATRPTPECSTVSQCRHLAPGRTRSQPCRTGASPSRVFPSFVTSTRLPTHGRWLAPAPPPAASQPPYVPTPQPRGRSPDVRSRVNRVMTAAPGPTERLAALLRGPVPPPPHRRGG